MQDARYAIYLAPPPDTPLWEFGSRVLGYDAVTGRESPGFAPAGLDPAAWWRLTERPRLYGFHATLKAPFRLAPGQDEDALFAALERFCKARPAFPLGPLGIEAIASGAGAGFVAMIQVRPSPALALLEHDTVRAFDGFRAPPTEDELRRRRPESLSERQREALARFGYPHVGPDYRFHMTLSGETVDVAPLADSLAEAMANRVGSAHLDVDALVLFRQPQAGAPFRVLRRFALEGLSTD